MSEEIRTARLRLRPVALEDLDDYIALYADPEVVRFIGEGMPATRGQSLEWLERTMARNALEGWDLRTVRLHDGTFLGRCGIAIHEIDGRPEPEVGYALAREHWGMGYATEAAIAMRDHAIGTLGHRRLASPIWHGNESSARVAEKLGMRYERDADFRGRRVRLFSMEV